MHKTAMGTEDVLHTVMPQTHTHTHTETHVNGGRKEAHSHFHLISELGTSTGTGKTGWPKGGR